MCRELVMVVMSLLLSLSRGDHRCPRRCHGLAVVVVVSSLLAEGTLLSLLSGPLLWMPILKKMLRRGKVRKKNNPSQYEQGRIRGYPRGVRVGMCHI